MSVSTSLSSPLDAVDRAIVVETQGGLPLTARPYDAIAARVGISAEAVMTRMRHLLKAGVIRRIGAVPNHYRLGYHGNGMSVWDLPDASVAELGRRIGELEFVSHCYRRPRHLPLWPYNLFVMVHGRDRSEVMTKVQAIAELCGKDLRGHEVLFSIRILKKTGLRLAQ